MRKQEFPQALFYPYSMCRPLNHLSKRVSHSSGIHCNVSNIYLYICHVSYSMLSCNYVSNPSPPFIPPSFPFSSFPSSFSPPPSHTDIQTRNYHVGLEKYNQMVATGSKIGTFIPGLKVLLQLALQLNI